jgi:hypothetical protein
VIRGIVIVTSITVVTCGPTGIIGFIIGFGRSGVLAWAIAGHVCIEQE